VKENDISKAAFSKIRPDLLSNYYSILSNIAPPPCQVKEQEYTNNVNDITALKKFIKKGVLNSSIPSIVVDSAATSSVGTPTAPLIPTGCISNKIFQLPDGTRTAAATVSKLVHNVRQPAKDIHIVPSIESKSLLSTAKFVKACYITVFDNKEVNIYDTHNTTFKVSRAAILRGWFDRTANLWQIPLIPVVLNSNTDTVLVNKPPAEFLPDCLPAINTIHNVYKLKTQPELVRYLHACAGFPTKPSWIKAIKNRQYASWPGLTIKAAAKYFPESKETMKGCGCKTKSGLRSTKIPAKSDNDNADIKTASIHLPHPPTKQKELVLRIFDLSNKAQRLMYTDQTRKFPKKSSAGNQYIMVLIKIDSNVILVEAMKNRSAGEMIRAYLILVNPLCNTGVTPKMHILDNECSEEFKAQICKNNMTFQLVPPHDHQRNIAEKPSILSRGIS
jgi:hypothetical protein